MVVRIVSGKDVQGALNYNEQKVMDGQANLITASGFLKEPEQLTFYDKLNKFIELNERNRRTKTNTLHVSLNFDPSETFDTGRLSQIASVYMDRIGFGDQPFLVYQHHDAAHPHLHIVTTLIQYNGNRIPIHNLGRDASEVARKAIEEEFGLVRAQDIGKLDQSISPLISKAIYGKSETKRSIASIVSTVTRQYKFSSLMELNAVLRLFNVTADRGTERSQMFQKGGLMYSLIDEKGQRVGIPIKASAIAGKPMLKKLERLFILNATLRNQFIPALRERIDRALSAAHSMDEFKQQLSANQIDLVIRRNTQGMIYGLTYVDHQTKSVFKGSDLGKGYAAKELQERLLMSSRKVSRRDFSEYFESRIKRSTSTVVEDLLRAEANNTSGPDLSRSKKKRRKKPKF